MVSLFALTGRTSENLICWNCKAKNTFRAGGRDLPPLQLSFRVLTYKQSLLSERR